MLKTGCIRKRGCDALAENRPPGNASRRHEQDLRRDTRGWAAGRDIRESGLRSDQSGSLPIQVPLDLAVLRRYE